ncbi:cuticle protein CP14.6-like [Armigeres subalbatus]|uniref:cuticle protein CP14.6-like n=1 Tax=Armigeres subalbatus TaxID=124917 RepID=UPI002ED21BC4
MVRKYKSARIGAMGHQFKHCSTEVCTSIISQRLSKMFRLMIASALIATSFARSLSEPEAHANILSYHNVLEDGGHYNWAFEGSNGIAFHEEGLGAHQANGAYSYTGPDGAQYLVSYAADENGFHPEGKHLPTPPPTPEHVIKSLEEIRANPPKDQKDFSLDALEATINRLKQ